MTKHPFCYYCSRYAGVALCFAFILVTYTLTIIYLRIGWHLQFHNAPILLIFTLYLAFCFLSVFWRPFFSLAKYHVRKPLLEEERTLRACLNEVLDAANDEKYYQLFIAENDGLNAFATGLRNIALSRSLITRFSSEQLKGVLAHELGHLCSPDCLCAFCMNTALQLPLFVIKGGRMLWRFVAGFTGASLVAILLVICGLYFIIHRQHLWIELLSLLFGRLESDFED